MKKAVITGATGGIGEAIARKFASLGYELILIFSKNLEKAQLLKEELSAQVPVSIYSLDFSDTKSYTTEFQHILNHHSSIDVLIHSAGISVRSLFHEMQDSEFERLFEVNVKPLFYLTKEVVPKMISKGEGSILSISSIWGSRAASMEVAYSMTKGAVEQFTRSLAAELSHMNIRVNAIAPGGVHTELLSNLTPEEMRTFTEDIPFNRLASPEEIADLAAFLVQKGTYITGQVLTIDGGFTL